MNRTIKGLLVAGAIAMLFSALSVGVVFAEGDGEESEDSSGTTEETKASRGEANRAALAEALGVTDEELTEALKQVALARVDAAVEEATITEEKAAEIRAAIESGEGGGKHRLHSFFLLGGAGNGEALAEALGVTVDDLTAAGQQVALARVDAAVEAGTITEEKAAELRTAIESGEKPASGRTWSGKHGGDSEGKSGRDGKRSRGGFRH